MTDDAPHYVDATRKKEKFYWETEDDLRIPRAFAVPKEQRPPLPAGWIQKRDERGRPFTFDGEGQPRCARFNPRKMTYCGKAPMVGKTRCWLHGGRALRGLAHPNFKHGKYSMDVQQRLLHRYMQARDRKDLLSLQDDIALSETRIAELLNKMGSGESGKLWKQLKNVYKQLTTALRRNREEEAQSLLAEIGQLIHTGNQEWATWDEIGRQQERKRKLTDTQRKLLVDAQQMITVDQMLSVVARLTSSIREHVKDPKALTAISAEIRTLLSDGRSDPIILTEEFLHE